MTKGFTLRAFPVSASAARNHSPRRVLQSISLCLALCFITTFLASFTVAAQQEPAPTKGGQAGTPPPGSAERKAVADALRREVKALHGLEVKFVITFLKVKNGWAWIETRPQSFDGKSRYEDIAALLAKVDGVWRVYELACTEPDNPDCLGEPGYFMRLRHRFPKAPRQIFPDR